MTPCIYNIPPKPTRYGGIMYRSRVEARWSVYFDFLGIRHEYEFEGFNLRTGGYVPDFWLPDLHLFVEVKGTDPTERECAKAEATARETEADILIAPGPPTGEFQMIWFDRGGRRNGLYVLHADKIAECGFWLLGDDEETANWVGPSRCETWPRGPQENLEIRLSVLAAMNARFDHTDDLNFHRVRPHEWQLGRTYRGVMEGVRAWGEVA